MTTFLFVLKADATSAQTTRMMAELEERFPEHDFLLGDANFSDYARNIVALVDGESGPRPKPTEVQAVVDFFHMTLRSIEGWKPS